MVDIKGELKVDGRKIVRAPLEMVALRIFMHRIGHVFFGLPSSWGRLLEEDSDGIVLN